MKIEQINLVAEEIWEVLRHSAYVVMSWGATDFKGMAYNHMPSLRFTVNGFLFKGTVIVTLNEGADLYEVYCLDAGGNVIKSCKEIYCDELVNKIDGLIEKNSSDGEYIKEVTEWLAKTV